MSSPINTGQHQFKETVSRRRASVVYGSLGKGGLYVPQDFIDNNIDYIEDEPEEPEPVVVYSEIDQRRESVFVQELLNEEAALLRDNDVAIKIPVSVEQGYGTIEEEGVVETWEEAVVSGAVRKTTYTRELQVIAKSSWPLVVTFLLQNSLSTVSIFSVGHLGATELAAVSLGAMTANITGYSTIQGLATCLDTLCPQAYGARRYTLVGVYFQRCTALIFSIMIPILFGWVFFSNQLLSLVIPDPLTAKLAADYIKIVAMGIPGYILFETGKRFLQAQGIFHAATYTLLVCAPLNGLMNWLFVWNETIGIGYLGAPLAVAINYWLMAIGLFLYTVTTKSDLNPTKCWGGLQLNEAFKHWGRLSSLALPGVIMLEAEFLAFEFLTLLASYLGTTALAAQSIAATVSGLSYQVPFAIGIAASTRIANFLGAGLPELAKRSSRVSLVFGLCVSFINCFVLFFYSTETAELFTSDKAVIAMVNTIMPLIAVMQIADAVNANSAGCLRGQGQQKIGGIVNLVSYYVVGIPLAVWLAFSYNQGLMGLWIGSTLALVIIGAVQTYYALTPDWEKLVVDAMKRSSVETAA